jgi:hypothetical protein
MVYAVDGSNNISAASAAIAVADLTAPVLSDVTAGQVEEGFTIIATSNENGMIYLVPAGTAANLGAINAAKVAEAVAAANVPVALSTTGIGLGNYQVYAVDGSNNISAASAAIAVVDLTPPVLTGVTPGPVEIGADIQATSNEDGMIYLVPGGTASNLGAITSAQVAQTVAVSAVPVILPTTGIDAGQYVVYAVDESDNISAASSVITVTEATYIDLSSVNPGRIQLFPTNVRDILHIKSDIQVFSVTIYTLQGVRMIQVTEPSDRIDMSGLKNGIYIVSIKLENNTVFNSKVTKR